MEEKKLASNLSIPITMCKETQENKKITRFNNNNTITLYKKKGTKNDHGTSL